MWGPWPSPPRSARRQTLEVTSLPPGRRRRPGAATCVVTFLLVDAVARRPVAVVAAALLIALDPLAISFDSRVMLEAPAQLAVVTMFLFIVSADSARRLPSPPGTSSWRPACTGGMAMVTKETFGLVVLVTLVEPGGDRMGGHPWRGAQGGRHRRGRLSGLGRRRPGVLRIPHLVDGEVRRGTATGRCVPGNSGFNAPNTHVSLLSRVVANGHVFGVTYGLLATGCSARSGPCGGWSHGTAARA